MICSQTRPRLRVRCVRCRPWKCKIRDTVNEGRPHAWVLPLPETCPWALLSGHRRLKIKFHAEHFALFQGVKREHHGERKTALAREEPCEGQSWEQPQFVQAVVIDLKYIAMQYFWLISQGHICSKFLAHLSRAASCLMLLKTLWVLPIHSSLQGAFFPLNISILACLRQKPEKHIKCFCSECHHTLTAPPHSIPHDVWKRVFSFVTNSLRL